jgi:hypothetical protein
MLHRHLLDTVRSELLQKETEVRQREEEITRRERELCLAQKEVEDQVARRLEEKRAALLADVRRQVEQDQAGVVAALEKQIADQQQAITDAHLTELNLRQQQRELEQRQNDLELEVQRKLAEQKTTWEQEVRRKADEEHTLALGALNLQLAEQQKAIEAAKFKEADLRDQQRVLGERSRSLDDEVEKKLNDAKAVITTNARAKAAEEQAEIVRVLQAEIQEKQETINNARVAELELLRRQRELEDRQKTLDLEVERKLVAARRQAEEAIRRQVAEEADLKQKESDKKIEDLTRQINDLKRLAEQGSQETQGEVLEERLEHELMATFRSDEIAPVPKGVRGADVVQRVVDRGRLCGTIIWETKNTKNWSEAWLTKLREDRTASKADVAILVTTALPRDMTGFGIRDNVWIAGPAWAVAVGAAVRTQLIQVAAIRRATAVKSEAVEVLFEYVTGPEFRDRVQTIVESFGAMQTELEQEKTATYKRWAKREKELLLLKQNTATMFGHLQGLIGPPMQTIPALEEGSDRESECPKPDADEEFLHDSKPGEAGNEIKNGSETIDADLGVARGKSTRRISREEWSRQRGRA